MQENNKKASILIWSIVISLMLWFIFISISNKVNTNLKQNIEFEKSIKNQNQIDLNIKKITENYKKILEESKKNNPNMVLIKKMLWEIEELKNVNNQITIKIKNENEIFSLSDISEKIIFYIPPKSEIKINVSGDYVKYESKNITSNSSEVENESWVIKDEKKILTNTYFKEVILKNSWWYSKIDIIISDYIISEKKYFQVFEKFWKKEILKQKWVLNIK